MNISTPVTTFLTVSLKPTISISSPTLTTPRSTRPVTTVPRPEIEKTSSIGIRKGLSVSRTGSGMFSSRAFARSQMHWASGPVGSFRALTAEPRTIVIVSPGNSYLLRRSRTSSSTRSRSSGSSMRSHLLRKTTIAGTLTCRARRTCSFVCGIGPLGASTTRIAPSICAAPVIMFLM